MSTFYNPSTGMPNQQQHQSGGTSGGFYSQGGYDSGAYGGYGMDQTQSQQQHQQWQPSSSGSTAGRGTSSSQSQQQQQQQQQPQQQPFWNPAASSAATLMTAAATGRRGFDNDAMMDTVGHLGQTIVTSSWAQMVPGLERVMITLRIYFAVDNQYVKKKMQKILFPFLSKQWKRLEGDPTGSGQEIEYALPNSDENAPDLYLPCMSLITYVLLCALCYGTAGKFNPEVIPDATTRCSVTQILEVLAIRFGFYSMQVPIPFLDLVSYTGYKYLGLSINMLVGLALAHFGYGVMGYYVTFLWTASAASFFMLRTMANNIPMMTAATGPKREFMVLGFAASQLAAMLFMSQTKFLRSEPIMIDY